MWARQDLVAELKGLGLLRTDGLERSFLRVRQESFLPELFGPLAYADMPLPLHAAANPATTPSAEGCQMPLNATRSPVVEGPPDGRTAVHFRGLLAIEDPRSQAWVGRATGQYDQRCREGVVDTCAGGPLDLNAFDPAEEACKD